MTEQLLLKPADAAKALAMSERQLLRKSDAAKLLNMSVSTLEKLTSKRRIPHVKLGRTVRYDTLDLWGWIDAKKIAVPPSAAVVPR